MATVLLVVPFCFALFWSHVKYLWIDELLELYSDTRPSLLAVFQGQLRSPFSLEPPLYHLLLHCSYRVMPHHAALAVRVPAMLFFGILQACLFRLMLRLTGRWWPALFAAALPLAVSTFFFSVEARSYELLACLFALALLAYCTALQSTGSSRRRALLALTAALSAAVLSHYYGLLEPMPFVVAEIYRAARRRRIDWGTSLAVLSALASFLCNLPFLPALGPVQARYYDMAQTAWNRIPFTYAWLFGQNDIYDQDLYSVVVRNVARVIAFCLLPVAFVLLLRRRRHMLPTFVHASDRDAFLVVLSGGLLLPLVAVALGHCVTHAYWLRYALETAVPALVVLSAAAGPRLRGWPAPAALTLVLVIAGYVCFVHISKDQRLHTLQDARYAVSSPALLRAEQTVHDPHLYMQQVGFFLELNTFAPLDQRVRLVEFDSPERAAHWNMQTPITAFAQNIHASTPLPYTSYENLRSLPGPHLVLVTGEEGEEWIGHELKRPGATIQADAVGMAFRATLYEVTFKPEQ